MTIPDKTQRSSLLHVSAPPHIRQKNEVPSIMLSVVIALIPAIGGSVFFFGIRSLAIVCTCVGATVATEWFLPLLLKKHAHVKDMSAIVTGILLSLSLPPTIPLWMAATGSIFGIVMAKLAFGGLGNNFLNPALAGRAFLMLSYPVAMTTWIAPVHGTLHGLSRGLDGITAATPLVYFKNAMASDVYHALDFQDVLPMLFTGNTGGCIGETSAMLLLVGATYLWYKRVSGLTVPFTILGTVFFLSWIFNGTGSYVTSEAFFIPFYQILTGGLMLGALFMATDPVTSPITFWGRVIFGTGCGVLTFILRKFGGAPEGICFAILFMNCCTPLIDKAVRPKRYGEVKKSE
jgi:Na+-translocating ferredoxin:NAD+ oxidoreductase subunit D